jgi:DNA repair exonuclease SbcCD ATPase subunit
MKINFIDVSVRNFLSFGDNFISFAYKPGIHAVTGNLIPNTTIRNGIGKTSLLVDSLSFLLYGKTLRNINKEEIINTTNRDNCVVKGTFSIGDKVYRVERGIKPNFLKIKEKNLKEWLNNNEWSDDKDEENTDEPKEKKKEKTKELDSLKHTQALLEEKIKISFTCFTNMVILSTNQSKPFLEMEPKDKRSLLEDILSLGIYGRMSEKAKSKHLAAKSEMTILENNLKNAISTFDLTKNRKESLFNETLRFEKEKQNRIEELNIKITTLTIEKETLENKIKNVDFTNSIKQLEHEIDELTKTITSQQNNRSSITKEFEMNKEILEKLDHSEHCPLCHTPTNSPLINNYINELKSKNIVISDSIKKINETIELANNEKLINKEKLSKIRSNDEKLKIAKSKIRELANSIQMNNENLKREMDRKLEIKEIISEKEFIELEKCVTDSEEKFNIAQKDFKYNKFIRTLLGEEGVRKYVTMKVLPILNRKVNHYLSLFGSDYNITFDNELKEKLVARNRDVRSYASFSGGEKKRIDLSLLLALMDVSKERNSIDSNILVLDEILDSSLDTVGAESFLEHLKSGFKLACPDKCIYIISHKKELGEEKFDTIIHLTKKNGFTNIDRII